MQKKWYRSINYRMIGGVAGGIAEYFDIEPVIVRIIFVCALFFGGLAAIVLALTLFAGFNSAKYFFYWGA